MSTGSRLELEPTMAHHVLAAVEEKGLIGMLFAVVLDDFI